jgi:antitoxin (DNA-binding transcriptional repressor) of toxin-antitoxin stability system
MCYAVGMKTLSVTEAARSFNDFVNRVYSRKESFAIAKLGVPYALLVPAATGCNSHELAADLASANLPAEDRRHLAAAIRKGRRALKPVKNPWG